MKKKTVTTSLQMPKEYVDFIKKLAAQQDRSAGSVIRGLIRDRMNKK